MPRHKIAGTTTVKATVPEQTVRVEPEGERARPPTTTTQEDLTTAGQRRVNLIWEYTQAFIAIIVVICTMGAGSYLAYTQSAEPIPTIMSVAFGTVVGFYFSRTNHAAIGGIGAKPEGRYLGR